jgi:glyoxylase-like metal-dependent hydrolase (beta-lactamase superfamily II)
MPRATPLTEHAIWWPSTLYQTTTLELRRDGKRMLIDPGISPWEIEEVVESHADPVGHVLLTHADWDHILGVPHLPDATVVASTGAAVRIESGDARSGAESSAREAYVTHGDLGALRVDQPVDAPCEMDIGPWHVLFRSGNGHTDDGVLTSLPEQALMITGDYLSELEIPAAYHSVSDYRDTLHTLIGVIERERPRYVVVGHGRPHTSDRALEIADQDLDYIEAVLAFAEAGCAAEHAERIAVPDRGGCAYDQESHARNVRLACEALTTA